jgi:ABC-type lipopolysaccharide export system ATPase subunit
LQSCNKTFAAKLKNCCGRGLLGMALVSLMVVPGVPVVAQATSAGSPALQARSSHRRLSIDDRVKVLARSLDLDQTQQAALKRILEQRQQETLRIRRDPSISGSTRIEQFRTLQDNTVLRIRAVLNEEQRKKYDPLATRRIQPAPQQRSVEDWLKATTQE